MVKDFNKKDN